MVKSTTPATAFPLQGRTHTFPGMTLRDWFAGHALAHIIGNLEDWPDDKSEIRANAEVAYMYADAMLEARK